MHALPRWTVRARIPRCLDSTHELLQRGWGVLASCDLDRMGCDSLLNLWGRHLRDSHWLPHYGQHGLHALPPQQRPALAHLGVVSLQGGLLLRPDHGHNNDGLWGLPCGDVPAFGRRRDSLHAL
jgi:hypothetical protein